MANCHAASVRVVLVAQQRFLQGCLCSPEFEILCQQNLHEPWTMVISTILGVSREQFDKQHYSGYLDYSFACAGDEHGAFELRCLRRHPQEHDSQRIAYHLLPGLQNVAWYLSRSQCQCSYLSRGSTCIQIPQYGEKVSTVCINNMPSSVVIVNKWSDIIENNYKHVYIAILTCEYFDKLRS